MRFVSNESTTASSTTANSDRGGPRGSGVLAEKLLTFNVGPLFLCIVDRTLTVLFNDFNVGTSVFTNVRDLVASSCITSLACTLFFMTVRTIVKI